jgi:hypothetical protein
LFKHKISFKKFQLKFCSKFKIIQIVKRKTENKKIYSYWAGPTGRSCGRSYPSSARKRSIGAPASLLRTTVQMRAIMEADSWGNKKPSKFRSEEAREISEFVCMDREE